MRKLVLRGYTVVLQKRSSPTRRTALFLAGRVAAPLSTINRLLATETTILRENQKQRYSSGAEGVEPWGEVRMCWFL